MGQKYPALNAPVMMSVKNRDDVDHPSVIMAWIILKKSIFMILSKSFGYALRGILYLARLQDENRKIQIDEMANNLSVPKHFLGKIMQLTVKSGLLRSTKGPYGGFSLTSDTLQTPLIKLVEITDGVDQFKICVLKLKYCNGVSPCPLHYEMEQIRTRFLSVFTETTIGDLLKDSKPDFIKSLRGSEQFS